MTKSRMRTTIEVLTMTSCRAHARRGANLANFRGLDSSRHHNFCPYIAIGFHHSIERILIDKLPSGLLPPLLPPRPRPCPFGVSRRNGAGELDRIARRNDPASVSDDRC